MRNVIYLVALLASSAAAEDWVLQDKAGIQAALSDQVVRYDAHTVQSFSATGATQFLTERAADGRWAARGDQYCSVWPPSDVWSCYDVYLLGDQIRFVAADRSESVGQIAP